MPIKVERTKTNYLQDDSAEATAAINQFRFVRPTTGVSTGSMAVDQCDTQGEFVYGVCKNSPAAGEMAEIALDGICEVEASETFNAGTQLMTTANGRCMTATTGEFVRAIAREASSGAGHLVSVHLVHFYAE